MEQGRFSNGPTWRSTSSLPQPDYNSHAVRDALLRLASIDLLSLCNEAKVEHCRATRDLRSCSRPVECVLVSCGHASLCAECSQRCDVCPICRTPLAKNDNRLRLGLYYQCVEAGLISKICGGKPQEGGLEDAQMTADVGRLYSFFDIALENNLCSLICQYVTDVCMDESAVSSDPVIAFLLDEAVVKDWCKRTFRNTVAEIRSIYSLEVDGMDEGLESLQKYSAKLSGLCNVLEVLELSFKGTQSAKLDDLEFLHESILKTKQHMEMMIWCTRHRFLENVASRYPDLLSWRDLYHERKSAAVARAWPEPASFTDSSGHGTLFIEDALSNLEVEKGYGQLRELEQEIASLQKDGGSCLIRAKIEGLAGCYPFENLRAVVDTLFLYGSCDMVIAKRAIFLYYLFDRQWTIHEGEWGSIMDDFAATFGVSRHSLLESFSFYLLDDHSPEALEEACRLLPEVSTPESHSKIAKVLLERQNPDAALMFLRWSGRDGGAELSPLSDTITATRVRVESGLLTEAFMYQRMMWMKAREREAKHPHLGVDSTNGEIDSWMKWMEILVTEICLLSIRSNLVDRIIELPWDSDEEKHLHKCFLYHAIEDPSTIVGSLLVVYYLQRYRYIDAYHVHYKLRTAEEEFLSKENCSEEVLSRMNSTGHWRAGLVSNCIGLLPEVQQQQLRAGMLPGNVALSCPDPESDRKAEANSARAQAVMPSSSESSLLLQIDRMNSSLGTAGSASFKPDWPVNNNGHDLDGLSGAHQRLFSGTERGLKRHYDLINGKFGDASTPARHSEPTTPMIDKEIFQYSSRALPRVHQNAEMDNFYTPEAQRNSIFKQLPKISPHSSHRVMAKPERTPLSSRGLLNGDSPQERYSSALSKMLSPGSIDRTGMADSSVDAMVWSDENGAAVGDINQSGEARWRSGDTSDEEEQIPDIPTGASSRRTTMGGSRRSRLSRR